MARRSGWRKECPDLVRERQTCCPRLFLLRQTGPIAFTLQEQGHVIRVRLGDPHECSCRTFRKEHELCIHICWTLIKKFRLVPEDPLSYQLGLVPLELEALIKGTHSTNNTTPAQKSKPSLTAPLTIRPISPRDVCPICLENLLKSRRLVTRCRYGCGRPVHICCISILAKYHKQEVAEKCPVLRCPMCRGDFCTFEELQKLNVRRQNIRRLRLPPLVPPPVLHAESSCCSCLMFPVEGALYRCLQCPLVLLCARCAASTVLHYHHALAVKQTPQDRWRRVRQKSATSSEIVLPAMRVQQCNVCPIGSRGPSPLRSSPLNVSRLVEERKVQRKKQVLPQLGLGSALLVRGLSLSDRRDHQKRVPPNSDVATSKYSSSASKMTRRGPSPSPGSTLSITSLKFPDHLTRISAPRQRKQSGCERRWGRSAGRSKIFMEPPQLVCSRVRLYPRNASSRLVASNCHKSAASYSDAFDNTSSRIAMFDYVSETLAHIIPYLATSQEN